MTRYVSAEAMKADDFGIPFTNEVGERVYDAKTIMGPWATMTRSSWEQFAMTRQLGLGIGQEYVRDAQGHLNKTEG